MITFIVIIRYFPSIFGPNEDQPLLAEVSLSLMKELTQSINSFLAETDPSRSHMTVQEVAMGFVAVANEAMCRPIRALTQVSGLWWVWSLHPSSFLIRRKVTTLLVTF